MRCTAGLGCVAHDATAEAMLAVVLLRAPYEDRPWGWTRNEISLIVIDLESLLTAPCVLTIRTCHHNLLFIGLMNQCIQLGVSVDYVFDFRPFLDVRGYTTRLVQLKVLHIQKDAQGFGVKWCCMGRPCSEHVDITITLVAIALSRAEAMLAQLGAWSQLTVFVATACHGPVLAEDTWYVLWDNRSHQRKG